MPPIIGVYEEDNNRYGTWSHIFQGANTTWLSSTQQIIGNFFNGLQANTQNMWNTQIPPNSVVLSATMEMTPFQNNFNPSFDAIMNTPNRASASQALDPVQSPFEIFQGYRRDSWSNAQVGALSTTFTAVFGTSVTTNSSWILRQLTEPGGVEPIRSHMAQKITTRTGNMTIASLFWDMSRTGNPLGSMRVRIQGITVDRGVTIPDGVDIAVSNDVLCSSVPGAQSLVVFTFAVNPTLVALTDYFIIIEADYVANNADYINIYHQNQFLTNGQLYHWGDGLGADWQNYPGTVDVQSHLCAVGIPAEDVTWPMDSVSVGVTEVSPDISGLVQAQIDAPNYTIDSGIIINLTRADPSAQQRRIRSNVQIPGPGPILRVTYEEGVAGIKHRTHDRFNDLTPDHIQQAKQEDDELLVISDSVIRTINQ